MAKGLNKKFEMGLNVSGNNKLGFHVSIKTIVAIVFGIISLAGVWFTLQADIQEARELPKPSIDRIEYDLKDELIRQTIIETQKDIESILAKLEKLDERLYKMSLEQ